MTYNKWYKDTAQHMWRTFFAIEKSGYSDTLSDARKKIYSECKEVFSSRFTSTDQDILKMYFTSRWGDDFYSIEDYSLKHNVPVNVIWIVIHRANRIIMEHIGLLDRRDERDE